MRVLFAVLALSLVVLSAPAGAATVSSVAYSEPPSTTPEESCSRYAACPPATVTFQAAAGEANVVSVSTGPAGSTFRDSGAPLTAGAGCTGQSDGSVVCPGGQTTVDLADGNDSVQSNFALFLVRGGDGDDVLAGGATMEGGPGNDTLNGSPNADRLLGGSGRDVLNGDDGGDVLVDDGGVEADQIDGGGGSDELAFGERDEPVRVDLGARPQEGGSENEGNTVANVERASGGRGPDELLGDPAAPPSSDVVLIGGDGDDQLVIRGAGTKVLGGPGGDTITGGPGNDNIDSGLGEDTVDAEGGNDLIDGGDAPDDLDGGDGRDIVLGGPSADRIAGGAGNDRLAGAGGRDVMRGEAGNDFLNGGGGNDQLFGGAGRDQLLGDTGRDVLRGEAGGDRITGGVGPDRAFGGAGPDVISVADRSRDRADCGAGRDRVTLDRRDRATGCERRRRR